MRGMFLKRAEYWEAQWCWFHDGTTSTDASTSPTQATWSLLVQRQDVSTDLISPAVVCSLVLQGKSIFYICILRCGWSDFQCVLIDYWFLELFIWVFLSLLFVWPCGVLAFVCVGCDVIASARGDGEGSRLSGPGVWVSGWHDLLPASWQLLGLLPLSQGDTHKHKRHLFA